MKRFYIVYNPDKDTDSMVLDDLCGYIQKAGGICGVMNCYEFGRLSKQDVENIISGYECILVLGGDGTLLNAASSVSHVDIPMFGMNMGTVGFLTEGELPNRYEILDRLLDGDFSTEERMMIKGSVLGQDGSVYRKRALNDIVITRAGFSRLIGLDVYVDGSFLNTYEGDGIIVSTPTGSTGYNLSAGGPVVDPTAQLLIITPVCPHSITCKSIVLPRNARIDIAIAKKRKTQDTEAIVSFDGGNDMELSAGDVLSVESSQRITRLIKASNVNFYEILRNKLGGK